LAVLLAACNPLANDAEKIIALEIYGPAERTIEEGDTLTLTARALNLAGDTVPGAVITWEMVDVDSGQVGFTLDESTGLVTAYAPGSGRVRPRVEDLTTLAVITVTVTAAPDSVAPGGDLTVALAPGDSLSPPLAVVVYDLTTDPPNTMAIAEKPVQFYLVDPVPGSPAADGFFLTVPDSLEAGPDLHRITATTDAGGRASAVARRIAGIAVPDSAVVDAMVTTAAGVTVAGSPIRFVVIFDGG
jgi:hypothetical protein